MFSVKQSYEHKPFTQDYCQTRISCITLKQIDGLLTVKGLGNKFTNLALKGGGEIGRHLVGRMSLYCDGKVRGPHVGHGWPGSVPGSVPVCRLHSLTVTRAGGLGSACVCDCV